VDHYIYQEDTQVNYIYTYDYLRRMQVAH